LIRIQKILNGVISKNLRKRKLRTKIKGSWGYGHRHSCYGDTCFIITATTPTTGYCPLFPPTRRVYSPPPPLPPQLSPAPVNQATTTPRSETKPQTLAANLQTSTLSKPVESKSVPTPTPTSAPLDPLEQWNRLALIGSYSESDRDQDGTQDNRESEQGDGEGTLAPGRSIAGSRIVDEAENVLIPRVVPGLRRRQLLRLLYSGQNQTQALDNSHQPMPTATNMKVTNTNCCDAHFAFE
jgi:hypothetical protein